MAGFWYKNANNQWSKIKNIYYKSAANTWSKAKGGRYKPATNTWTNNLLQDFERQYIKGNADSERRTDGFRLRALNDATGSEIGAAFNTEVDITSYSTIRFLVDISINGSVSGGVVCSFWTSIGGNKDQFTARTENINSGNNINIDVSASAYTGNHYLRFHVYQNATTVTSASRVSNLKRITGITSGGVQTIIWEG